MSEIFEQNILIASTRVKTIKIYAPINVMSLNDTALVIHKRPEIK